jgi:hypothetical protein
MKGGDGSTYRFIGFGMMARGMPRYRVCRSFPLTVMAEVDRAAVNSLLGMGAREGWAARPSLVLGSALGFNEKHVPSLIAWRERLTGIEITGRA